MALSLPSKSLPVPQEFTEYFPSQVCAISTKSTSSCGLHIKRATTSWKDLMQVPGIINESFFLNLFIKATLHLGIGYAREHFPRQSVKYSIQTRKLLIDLPCEKINVYSTLFYPSADLIVSRKQSECMSLMKQYSM